MFLKNITTTEDICGNIIYILQPIIKIVAITHTYCSRFCVVATHSMAIG
jgi:hypothetical protein